MSSSANEMQPDVEVVLQVEEPEGSESAVKVEQQGPVRNQPLPRQAGGTRTVTVQALPSPFRLLRANPRRAVAVVTSPDPFMYAYNAASAQDPSTMALWPALTPLKIGTNTDVWVAAITGSVEVSYGAEYWATGEGDD